MSIEQELDRLERMILDSTRLPLGRTLINEEETLDVLDRVRINLPKALSEAATLLQNRDAILAQAQQQANQTREQSKSEGEQIIAAAKREAERYLNESELIRAAEREASEIRTEAAQEWQSYQKQAELLREKTRQDMDQVIRESRAQADQILAQADEYADQVLARLERELDRALQVIRQSRQQLKPQNGSVSPTVRQVS